MIEQSWLDASVEDDEDVEGAYEFCRRLGEAANGGGVRFSRLAAKSVRRHVAVLTAFSRIADGITERPGSDEDRKARLDEWRRQLWAVGKQPAHHPVFLAMESTLEETGVPREPLDEIMAASLQDCTKKRYGSFDELLEYCRRAANSRGRVILMAHGYQAPELLTLSDHILTAGRLTRFLAELPDDLKRDRIYLPEEDFQQFSYTEADLRMGVVNERFRSIMKHQWKKARELFERGRPLLRKLPWPLSWRYRLAWLEGNLLLRRIRRDGFDTLHRRPRLSAWDWPRLAAGVLLTR